MVFLKRVSEKVNFEKESDDIKKLAKFSGRFLMKYALIKYIVFLYFILFIKSLHHHKLWFLGISQKTMIMAISYSSFYINNYDQKLAVCHR